MTEHRPVVSRLYNMVFELRNGTPVTFLGGSDLASQIAAVENQIRQASGNKSPETNPDLDVLNLELAGLKEKLQGQ